MYKRFFIFVHLTNYSKFSPCTLFGNSYLGNKGLHMFCSNYGWKFMLSFKLARPISCVIYSICKLLPFSELMERTEHHRDRLTPTCPTSTEWLLPVPPRLNDSYLSHRDRMIPTCPTATEWFLHVSPRPNDSYLSHRDRMIPICPTATEWFLAVPTQPYKPCPNTALSNDPYLSQHSPTNDPYLSRHSPTNDPYLSQHSPTNDPYLSQHSPTNDTYLSQPSRSKVVILSNLLAH